MTVEAAEKNMTATVATGLTTEHVPNGTRGSEMAETVVKIATEPENGIEMFSHQGMKTATGSGTARIEMTGSAVQPKERISMTAVETGIPIGENAIVAR